MQSLWPNDVVVLCYHAVSPSWAADLSVTPAKLEAQVTSLLRRGYRAVTFSEAVLRPSTGRTMAVTFDDAFKSVLDLAFPILDRLEVPATVFAPTDWIDSGRPMAWSGVDHWVGGPHEPELMGMSWEDLRLLSSKGWEIGSHTRTHARLPLLDDAALRAELTESRRLCAEALSTPCDSIAYPYGRVDSRVLAATAAAGYSAGAALPHSGWPREIPLAWPRVGIYHGDDDRRFHRQVSPGLRRLRRSPFGPVLEQFYAARPWPARRRG